MATEVRKGALLAVRVLPASPMTSPTAVVYDRAGTVLATLTATADTVSTTISTAAVVDVVTLASAAGVGVGRYYQINDVGESPAVVEVAALESSVVSLLDSLQVVPPSTTPFVGIEVAVTLTAPCSPTVGTGYRLVVSDTATDQQVTWAFDVANQPFVGPVDAAQVRTYFARFWPSELSGKSSAFFERVARKANNRLRSRVRNADRYLARYWDVEGWQEPGELLYRQVLAEAGYFPGQFDPQDYLQSLKFDVRDLISDLLTAPDYDADGDNDLDADEIKQVSMISMRRGGL
ncbi:MAG: hypothetical protein ACI9MR_000015 [Myxococcota bacterium]|jgi:hypothetical protein